MNQAKKPNKKRKSPNNFFWLYT